MGLFTAYVVILVVSSLDGGEQLTMRGGIDEIALRPTLH
jgi:hypothetical protein